MDRGTAVLGPQACGETGRTTVRAVRAVIAPTEERTIVPRKPNYKFERMERDRAKAAKKAERLKLKQERAEQRKAELAGPNGIGRAGWSKRNRPNRASRPPSKT